jgi:hypothetical protein
VVWILRLMKIERGQIHLVAWRNGDNRLRRAGSILQGAAVHRGDDPVGGSMIFDVRRQLPRLCTDAAGPRRDSGSHHQLSVDPGLCRRSWFGRTCPKWAFFYPTPNVRQHPTSPAGDRTKHVVRAGPRGSPRLDRRETAEELYDALGDFIDPGLQCEMARVHKRHLCRRLIPFEGFCAGRKKERVVTAPDH